MTLQVIDGLKALGASPSSTFVIPVEFTRQPSENGQVAAKQLAPTP